MTTILPKFGRKLFLPKFGRKLHLPKFGRIMLFCGPKYFLRMHDMCSDLIVNLKMQKKCLLCHKILCDEILRTWVFVPLEPGQSIEMAVVTR